MKPSFASLIVLLLAASASAQVRTWVSPNGIDTAPCTLTAPCRNFAAAIAAVDAAGEVIPLTSAGYGPVTIDKSVAIIAPEGVHAAIAPTAAEAVRIEAGPSDQIVLRNLYLNAQGASFGIRFLSGSSLFIEKCTAANFSSSGIEFNPTTADTRVFISDTTTRQNNAFGIFIDGQFGTFATLDNVRAHRNDTGVSLNGVRAIIRRSEATGNAGHGFIAFGDSLVAIEDSVSSANGTAMGASESEVTIMRSSATDSGVGLRGDNLGILYVTDSTIVGNALGIEIVGAGEVRSRGNNTLLRNNTDGAFTLTFGAD